MDIYCKLPPLKKERKADVVTVPKYSKVSGYIRDKHKAFNSREIMISENILNTISFSFAPQ